MALTEELPLFRKMFELVELIYDERQHFPRMARYDIGSDLFRTALDCSELIQAANMNMAERIQFLNEFARTYGRLRLLLRLCIKKRLIGQNKTAQILQLCGEIGQQSTGWRKYSSRNLQN